jgi:hypothetical protein
MKRTTFALALALTLSACGGGDPVEAGYDAFADQRYEDAVASLDTAIASLDKESTDYRDAVLTRCQALVHVDKEKAAAEFIASTGSVEWAARDYSKLISEFYSVKGYLDSLVVLEHGRGAFAENPEAMRVMDNLKDKVVAESKKIDDPALSSALRGIGYL